jgi:uncharacterized membrane protein YczE
VSFLPPPGEARRRLPQLLAGLVVMGLGIALMVQADLGLGPWDVLHQGLSERTGIPIGTVGILVGLPVLLLWLPFRQRAGIGTILNVIVIGLVIDAYLALAPEVGQVAVRGLLMVAGVVAVGVGCGLYIGAGLGPGPRDGLMTGMADRGLGSVRAVRTAIELSALALGFALGGSVGLGTILLALTVGPVVQATLARWERPAYSRSGVEDHLQASAH